MDKIKDKKILLTGGHASTSALSVVEELRVRYGKQVQIFWVGPKYSIQGKKVLTLAFQILPEKNVVLVPMIAGRFLRKINFWTFTSLLKLPLGFLHSLIILLQIKPDVILSFGGFSAFPVVIVGWLLRIKILFHDETYSFNRVNRTLQFFADKILLSREESLKYYHKRKSIVIGNPMLKSISAVKAKEKLSGRVTIYITGGSTGSVSLNDTVAKALKKLLENYNVIHQTGRLSYQRFVSLKEKLPDRLKNNYEVFANISPLSVHEKFDQADMIISRAGANTVSEIILVKRPSILIPLVIGDWNEQMKNAEFAKEYGIAKIIRQEELTSEILIRAVEELVMNWTEIIRLVKNKKSPDIYADKKLVDIIENYIS